MMTHFRTLRNSSRGVREQADKKIWMTSFLSYLQWEITSTNKHLSCSMCWCNWNTFLLVLLLLVTTFLNALIVVAWVVTPLPKDRVASLLSLSLSSSSFSNKLPVETVSLKALTNHEQDGTLLAESITRWLDHEVKNFDW
jgi:hypothetical protein